MFSHPARPKLETFMKIALIGTGVAFVANYGKLAP